MGAVLNELELQTVIGGVVVAGGSDGVNDELTIGQRLGHGDVVNPDALSVIDLEEEVGGTGSPLGSGEAQLVTHSAVSVDAVLDVGSAHAGGNIHVANIAVHVAVDLILVLRVDFLNEQVGDLAIVQSVQDGVVLIGGDALQGDSGDDAVGVDLEDLGILSHSVTGGIVLVGAEADGVLTGQLHGALSRIDLSSKGGRTLPCAAIDFFYLYPNGMKIIIPRTAASVNRPAAGTAGRRSAGTIETRKSKGDRSRSPFLFS